MNIGLMSICRGLSSSAGRRCSKKQCPTICNDQPITLSMAVAAHTHAAPTCSAVIAAIIRSGITAHAIAAPMARSRAIQKMSAGITKRAAAVVFILKTVTDGRLKGSTAAKNRSGVPMMCIAQLRLSRW